MSFETSDDLEFKLRGGQDAGTAMYNRIAAINRINFLVRKKLPEFDLRGKSQAYKDVLDLELYKKYYHENPNHLIDEEFCQRCADLCVELDSIPEEPKVDKAEFLQAVKEAAKPVNKGNFIQRFFKRE